MTLSVARDKRGVLEEAIKVCRGNEETIQHVEGVVNSVMCTLCTGLISASDIGVCYLTNATICSHA